MRRVDARHAHALISCGKYIYVDVRDRDEFEEGRPAGAVNVPLDDESGEPFASRMEKRFGKSAPVVVGCRSGKRSARAVAELDAAGFTDVVECRTGFDGTRGVFGELREPGWKREGLPTERG